MNETEKSLKKIENLEARKMFSDKSEIEELDKLIAKEKLKISLRNTKIGKYENNLMDELDNKEMLETIKCIYK